LPGEHDAAFQECGFCILDAANAGWAAGVPVAKRNATTPELTNCIDGFCTIARAPRCGWVTGPGSEGGVHVSGGASPIETVTKDLSGNFVKVEIGTLVFSCGWSVGV
jgi:hypothetical protein